MMRKVSYQSRAKHSSKPRSYEEEFYWPGDRVSIEVWDHIEGEEQEETGLLDKNGNPIIRLIQFTSHPIGFVWSEDDE